MRTSSRKWARWRLGSCVCFVTSKQHEKQHKSPFSYFNFKVHCSFIYFWRLIFIKFLQWKIIFYVSITSHIPHRVFNIFNPVIFSNYCFHHPHTLRSVVHQNEKKRMFISFIYPQLQLVKIQFSPKYYWIIMKFLF